MLYRNIFKATVAPEGREAAETDDMQVRKGAGALPWSREDMAGAPEMASRLSRSQEIRSRGLI